MSCMLSDMDRPGPGELLPLILAPCGSNPQFQVGSLGGRYLILCVTGDNPAVAGPALDLLAQAQAGLPLSQAVGLGLVPERDAALFSARQPSLSLLRDPTGDLARSLGFGPQGGFLIADRLQRVMGRGALAEGPALLDRVAGLCVPPTAIVDGQAPVLIVPDVFEPTFCRHLIELYHRQGNVESGFMRDVGGRTVGMIDPKFKRRRDMENMPDQDRIAARQRIERRLVPMIQRALQFRATRMERYIVACYDGASQGFFSAHRDNTTLATSHRRLAVTINLNTDDYEGGALRFPEFGPRAYRGPTGGAVVFSCSLLHEALPVTRGTRYAFIPFLYDEEAARQREASSGLLADNGGGERARQAG